MTIIYDRHDEAVVVGVSSALSGRVYPTPWSWTAGACVDEPKL